MRGAFFMKKEANYTKQQGLKAGLFLGAMTSSMFVFIFWWFFRDPDGFINQMGFNQTAMEIPLAWVLAIAVAAAYIAYTTIGIPAVRENFFRFNLLKVIGIFSAIASGIVEELVFRQMLMDWLYSNDMGVVLQVVISGVGFGIIHFGWSLFSGNFKTGLWAAIHTTVLGLLLAIIYIIAERNVLPVIMAHMLINLFIEPWLILNAVKESGKSEKKK
jgi:hypothetical protein